MKIYQWYVYRIVEVFIIVYIEHISEVKADVHFMVDF